MMSMDHVQLARALWVWFGYRIAESSEPGADSRVDALAAKLEQWLPALPYEPLRGDYIEQIALAQGWDVDDKSAMDDLDRFARTIEQAHGICITNMAGDGKNARYTGHNPKVAEVGPANLPRLEVDAQHLRRIAVKVQDWLGGGCDTQDIPRPAIAALATLVKELCTEVRPKYEAPVKECEACMTEDACRIRGQCAHYLREVTA